MIQNNEFNHQHHQPTKHPVQIINLHNTIHMHQKDNYLFYGELKIQNNDQYIKIFQLHQSQFQHHHLRVLPQIAVIEPEEQKVIRLYLKNHTQPTDSKIILSVIETMDFNVNIDYSNVNRYWEYLENQAFNKQQFQLYLQFNYLSTNQPQFQSNSNLNQTYRSQNVNNRILDPVQKMFEQNSNNNVNSNNNSNNNINKNINNNSNNNNAINNNRILEQSSNINRSNSKILELNRSSQSFLKEESRNRLNNMLYSHIPTEHDHQKDIVNLLENKKTSTQSYINEGIRSLLKADSQQNILARKTDELQSRQSHKFKTDELQSKQSHKFKTDELQSRQSHKFSNINKKESSYSHNHTIETRREKEKEKKCEVCEQYVKRIGEMEQELHQKDIQITNIQNQNSAFRKIYIEQTNTEKQKQSDLIIYFFVGIAGLILGAILNKINQR